jgi:thiol-disulfide isomerase/thioredoxin
MKRTILSLMLLAVGLLGAQAQGTEDLDAKYTKGLLPVGTTAPDFVIKKAKENQPALSLSDYRTHQEGSLQRPGCYVLLDFWATWCPDCRKEIPTVKEIYKNYKNKVKLIGVSFDTDKDKLKEFRNSNEIKWTMYCEGKKWKETNISKAYNIQWIPTMYLIDPEGKVAYTTVVAENMVKKLAELDATNKLTDIFTKPEFPGGTKAWQKAMDEWVEYPDIAKKYNGEAKIKISCKIDKEGKMSNIEVKEYKDYSLSGNAYDKLTPQQKEEAQVAVKTAFSQTLLKAMQKLSDVKWTPGKERGEAVNTTQNLTYTFRIPSLAFKKKK